ncbi:hypothetical protein EXN66_Car014816 [Channa argus]|uniref:Uncharacterized protein n=1 Tax=Channa argus TaxID=215402 RepID=A0A6G1Q9N9_CHAAH|nr:hypothetical protein EXN66_Car014816 [Channa argus]
MLILSPKVKLMVFHPVTLTTEPDTVEQHTVGSPSCFLASHKVKDSDSGPGV